MALTTLEYVKTAIGVSTSDKDAMLSLYLDAASEEIKRYLGLNIEQGTYTEYHTGNLTTRLALRQIPVTTLSGVWLKSDGYFDTRDGGFGSENLLVEGTDYVLDRSPASNLSKSGILYRIGTVWPMLHRTATLNRLTVDLGPSWGNIKVTYTAGYSTVPKDIQLACAILVSRFVETASHGGWQFNKETIGDYSYTQGPVHLNSKLPEFGGILGLLAPYKELGW